MKANAYMLKCFMQDTREGRDILQVLNLQDLLSVINKNKFNIFENLKILFLFDYF